MKNSVKLFGIIATVAIITFSMAACEQPTETAHVHDYEWTVTVPATCIATGEESGVCKLDSSHTATREIAIDTVNGHDWETGDKVELEPTCTTDGRGKRVCTLCEKVEAHGVLAALGHDSGGWHITLEATCTTTGTRELRCTRDSFVLNTEAVNALGHDWIASPDATLPTCTTAGYGSEVCTRCPETKSEGEIPALGHNIATGVYLCSVCNNPYELGDTGPGGGKIFYRTETGFTMTDDDSTAHYLEAAPSNLAGGQALAWASSNYTSTDIEGTATEIGTGRKNTALILATDANAPAAKACKDYNSGGKTDWFLPSRDEMRQIDDNKNLVGNLPNNVWYWTSFQFSSELALVHSFYSGTTDNYPKNLLTVRVRAVRAF